MGFYSTSVPSLDIHCRHMTDKAIGTAIFFLLSLHHLHRGELVEVHLAVVVRVTVVDGRLRVVAVPQLALAAQVLLQVRLERPGGRPRAVDHVLLRLALPLAAAAAAHPLPHGVAELTESLGYSRILRRFCVAAAAAALGRPGGALALRPAALLRVHARSVP